MACVLPAFWGAQIVCYASPFQIVQLPLKAPVCKSFHLSLQTSRFPIAECLRADSPNRDDICVLPSLASALYSAAGFTSILRVRLARTKKVPGRRLPGAFAPGNWRGTTAFAAKRIAECRRDGSRKLPPECPRAQSPRRFLRDLLPI